MMEPLTILVVDDEPAQRELLGGCLAKRGWSVVLAAGAEALAILRRTPVDLVLRLQDARHERHRAPEGQ
jgi:CheY-like chemotaxis protein